jgi:signal transduction histidine kinase/putative methionine-R-sulfoxide reductase with GAF domain
VTGVWLALGLLAGAALGVVAAVVAGRRAGRAGAPVDVVERRAVALERGALRRLGVLASTTAPEALFAAMAEELARIVDLSTGMTHVEMAAVSRYEADASLVVLAAWGGGAAPPVTVGSRWPLEGDSVNALVYRTGRPARRDGNLRRNGRIGRRSQDLGVQSSVCVPIVVDGSLWGGATVLSTRPEPLPPETEARIGDFAQLAATAISNAQAREQARRLADEQAALRRVATLVARGVDPDEVSRAVVAEIGQLRGADVAGMIQYEGAESVRVVATWSARGGREDVGGRWPLDGGGLSAHVARTGRPGRIDDWSTVTGAIGAVVRDRLGYRSSVASPILVEGRLWGAVMVHSTTDAPLPGDTEERMANFADLVATAMANAQARAEVRRLADEQAALRRVATLVARQTAPETVFASVVEEMGSLLGVQDARLVRFEADGSITVAATWGQLATRIPVGTTAPVDGSVAGLVLQTGRPQRYDEDGQADGPLATTLRDMGIRSSVGCPILVDGRLWGAVVVASGQAGRLPVGLHERMTEFTELVATAIANIAARADLAASRARIVVATDEARRRFERDLHDGAQQRLVSLALEVRGAEALTAPDQIDVRAQLAKVGEGLNGVLDDLRELSRGIHPAILSEGGLGPALRSLARRSAVPIRLEVEIGERLDERVEVAAYYVVSEALANAAKHAAASQVAVAVVAEGPQLDIAIDDDGVGGADPARGSGLMGIIDRVEALDGTVRIVSSEGQGTQLRAALPLDVGRSAVPG